MTLKELGELLRRERESRSLSIRQVMEDTKISRRILVALEEGDRSSLPHPVYTKGFVKNYARLLGLDEAVLAKAIDAEFGTETEEAPARPVAAAPRRPASPAQQQRRSWPTVLLIALLVVLLAAMVVYLQRKSMLGKAAGPTAPPAVQQQAAQEQAAPEAPAQQPMAVQPTPSQPEAAPAPAAPAPAQEQAAPQPAQAQPAPAAPAPAPAAPAPAAKTGPRSVVITAKQGQMCWMEVSVDGKEKKEYFIRSGEAVQFEYSEKFTVKLGNVGGVTVTHNGKPVPTDGAGWSVKTLTFP